MTSTLLNPLQRIQQAFGAVGPQPPMNPANPATVGTSNAQVPRGLNRLLGPHMMPIAGAMMTGRMENMGPGFAAAGLVQQREQDNQRQQAGVNATAQWLERERPDLAEAVRNGMPISLAWQEANKKPEQRQIMKDSAGRPRYVDTQEPVFSNIDTSGIVDSDLYKREREIRGDYMKDPTVKEYGDVRNSYERVRAAAKRAQSDKTGASDMAMIFNYMKMLDPGSAVRETEFANAAMAGGYGSRMQNLVANIKAGKLLTPEVRNEFVLTADAIYSEVQNNVRDVNKRFSDMSDRYQVDSRYIVTDPEQYAPIGSGSPPPGASIDSQRQMFKTVGDILENAKPGDVVTLPNGATVEVQ